MFARTVILFSSLFLSFSICHAAEYSLTVQPMLSVDATQKTYQPLADYLSKQTGHTIKLVTHRNFTFYWSKMYKKREGFDYQ